MTLQIELPSVAMCQPYASIFLICLIYLVMCRIYYMRVVFYICNKNKEYRKLLKLKDVLINTGDDSVENHEKLKGKINTILESKVVSECFLEFMSILWPAFVLYELVCFLAVVFFKVFLLVTLGTCKVK